MAENNEAPAVATFRNYDPEAAAAAVKAAEDAAKKAPANTKKEN